MQKPLTEKRLENIALFYLEKFDASSEKLRLVLMRRIKRHQMQGIPVNENATLWVHDIIQKCQRLGYINDERYAQNVIRRLSNSGKSARFIQQKLITEGIPEETISAFLSADDEYQRAQIFAHKQHLGNHYEKDLAKLARAGFSYDIARQVLQQKDENV